LNLKKAVGKVNLVVIYIIALGLKDASFMQLIADALLTSGIDRKFCHNL